MFDGSCSKSLVIFLFLCSPLFFGPLPHEDFLLYIVFLKPSGLTLVDYLDPHLSAYPIRHPLYLSVSCDS